MEEARALETVEWDFKMRWNNWEMVAEQNVRDLSTYLNDE